MVAVVGHRQIMSIVSDNCEYQPSELDSWSTSCGGTTARPQFEQAPPTCVGDAHTVLSAKGFNHVALMMACAKSASEVARVFDSESPEPPHKNAQNSRNVTRQQYMRQAFCEFLNRLALALNIRTALLLRSVSKPISTTFQ